MFVPSGGSKWIIEAPYVLQAAKDLHVNLGWIVQIYNYRGAAEPDQSVLDAAAAGNPEDARADLVGYGLLELLVNSVLVLFLMWFFARTLAYVPPMMP